MKFVYEFIVRGGGGASEGRDNIADHDRSCEEVANRETERHGENVDRRPQLDGWEITEWLVLSTSDW